MIPPLRPIASLLAAFAVLGTAVSAQDTAEGPQTKLRILALPPKTEHAKMFLLQDNTEAIPLEPTSSRLAGPYETRNSGRWRFAETAGAGGEQDAAPRLLASCKATVARDQLAVLVKKPDGSSEYGAFAVDLDRASLDQRQFLIVNLSPGELACEVGGKKLALKPGTPVVVTPKADKGGDLCQAAFYMRKGGAWHPFFSTAWPLRDKVRGLVFLYQDQAGGKIRLHAISDFL